MNKNIALIGPSQLVMTEEGYMSLENLYEKYTLQEAPHIAAVSSESRNFTWNPLEGMTRDYYQGEVIRVVTDTFELLAAPYHKVWAYDMRDELSKFISLDELFGHNCQFMGVFPMPRGDCPGYMVGTSCWYKEQVNDFLFDLETKSGFVFSRALSREAGIWSGIPGESD